MPLVEQELFTLPEHLSSPTVFSGVRVTRSLLLYVCFVDRCLSFCTFSFGHCVVCPFLIYGFCLPLWYLQTLLRLKSPLQTFYGHRHESVHRYQVYLTDDSWSLCTLVIYFLPFHVMYDTNWILTTIPCNTTGVTRR